MLLKLVEVLTEPILNSKFPTISELIKPTYCPTLIFHLEIKTVYL